jgi:bifunctional DNA-binding transcriptional regulator/antitoxin component of YhaV-PrlF toxin-antitoxin module
MKGRISIAADFDTQLMISAQKQNLLEADNDSDWVRNPITSDLLDTLNGRVVPPLDLLKGTVLKYDDSLDAMISSGHRDKESLIFLDAIEHAPSRNTDFLDLMTEHEKQKEAQWQQTKLVFCRSGLLESTTSADEMLIPVPKKLLHKLGWVVGDVLDIEMDEEKHLVLRKTEPAYDTHYSVKADSEIVREKKRRMSAAGLNAFFNIAQVWNLNIDQEMVLLGKPTRTTYLEWKKDPALAQLNVDTLERLSYILGIYKMLQVLLPDSSSADNWIKKPNDAPLFSGKSALEKILSGKVSDLFLVRRYLEGRS